MLGFVMSYEQLQEKIYFLLKMGTIVASITMSAAIYADDATTPTPSVSTTKDPYQKFNRAMFTFNDKLDSYVLKPIATLYEKIMPKPLNQGVHNFFNNIGELPTMANDLLQIHFYQFANDFWRFGINTTIGIGGLFDMATRMKLPYYSNDFGMTLATWGYRQSNYLVLPFFGPNTPRDTIGLPVDYFAFSIYPHIHPQSLRYEIYALGVIDRRAQLLKFQPVFDEAAVDKYTFMRDAYLQRRAYQIEENKHRSALDQLQNAQTNMAMESNTETDIKKDSGAIKKEPADSTANSQRVTEHD